MNKEQKNNNRVDLTFISDDENVQRKLTLLGYSFIYAVAEGETEAAKNIIMEAQQLKEGAGRV